MADWIKFMGTAGARFAVSRQLRSSAGTWCSFQGRQLLIDPGPGTLSCCFNQEPVLDPELLDAVILSHRHLDHSTDVNVMIEAMTRGTYRRRGSLFAPADAVGGEEPVVFSHVRRSVDNLVIMREGETYNIGGLPFETPLRHLHPAETYGFTFHLADKRVSFIVDTLFFPALVDSYRGTDLLIINVLMLAPFEQREIQHLDLGAAEKLIGAIKPRQAIMTHFGLTMLQNDPETLARELSKKTGIEVMAAYDGMTVNLS